MEQIRLDIVPKGIMPVCHASQYDKGRVIRCNLMDGLQGYVLTDETITLNVRKPDDNIVTAAVEVVSGTSYVDFVTTEQMTACEGDAICELTITKGDTVISTLNFRMQVEEDPLKDGIESETEIHNLTTQIHDINAEMVPQMVADEVASQYDSANVIFDDHPTAGHGTGYVVKSENVPDELNDLNDVAIDTPASNQALVWDADNNRWTNGEVSTVGSIDDLDDVDTTGKADGDSLRYDNTNHEWIAQPTTVALTQAEYDALQLSGDLVPNTHYVITDAPNLNATASDIEYSGAVTVKQAIDSKQNKAWSYIGGLYPNGPALDVSNYNELSVIIETGMSGGTLIHNFVGLMFKPMFDLYPTIRVAYYGSASYNVSGDLTYSSGSLTYTQFTLNGWDTNLIRVFGR